MTRVAVIDCGTNSIRLLIADGTRTSGSSSQHGQGAIGASSPRVSAVVDNEQEAADGLIEVDRRVELVRLGQGVDATGMFHPHALIRTFRAIDGYAELIEDAGVERLRFVATSASRDVQNRAEFEAGVRERLGVEVEVISGEEEARLSFSGALEVLKGRADVDAGPVLVTDIGGGSTELVVGEQTGQVMGAASVDIGAVRMRERFLRSDPATAAERRAAIGHVDRILDASDVPWHEARTWVGVAGTATSMAAMFLDLTAYDRARVHGAMLLPTDVEHLSSRIIDSTVEELTTVPTLAPLRAQVIAGGALICSRIAERVGVPLIVSETDILDAVATELV